MSPDGMTRDLRLAAQGARRQLEALARRAEVPLRSRVVRDEPLRALSIACAETRAVERGGAGRAVHRRQRRPAEAAAGRDRRHDRPRPGRARARGASPGPSSSPWRTSSGCRRMLRAAERLAALDGAEIVLLLVASDEERLAADGRPGAPGGRRRARTCASTSAAVARGEAAVDRRGAAPAAGRLRHLPVRRPGGARRGRPAAAGAACSNVRCFLVR